MTTKKKAKVDVARCNMGALGTCGARGNQGLKMGKVACGKGPNPWVIIVVGLLIAGAVLFFR